MESIGAGSRDFFRGQEFFNQGEYKRAANAFSKSVEACKKDGDKRGQANALKWLGDCYKFLSDSNEALKFYNEAWPLTFEVFGETSSESSLLLGRMSQTFREKRDFKRARELAQRNLELARKIGDDADNGMALHLIGDIAFAEGNYEEALRYCEEALPLAQHNRHCHALVLNLASLACGNLKMFERALVLRLDEIFLARILHGEDHPEYAMSLYNAAWLYSKLKLPEKACSYAERALAIRQKKLGPRHPHTIQAAEELKLYRRAVNDEEVARKMASDQRLCSRCSTIGSSLKVCSGCKKVQYCGTECQIADWKVHQSNCAPMLLEAGPPACANCGKTEDVKNRCSACLKVFYCTAVCQKQHWKQHKLECKK